MIVTEESIVARLVRNNFYKFVKEFWGTIIQEPPVWNWHIEYLCKEMQEMAERVFRGEKKAHDLVINISPGSSKSTVCSQMFPAWVWTRMPHAQLIHISYADQIARKDAIRTRDIVMSNLYQKCFPHIQLRGDVNAVHKFQNIFGGWRMAVGMDGQITGEHGHFIIIDDPLNPNEAFSEAELRSVNRTMESTLPTRKVNKAVTPIILIQQRLHQADPSGEMIKKERVRNICIPGELTENVAPKELIEKYKDGLFDPIRLSREILNNLRKDLGEYGYASQILQSPVPLGGGQFNVAKFNLMDEIPRGIVRLVRAWDKAGTKGGGAWTVGVLMALDKHGRYWILDMVRGQWSAVEREEVIRKTAEEDGSDVEITIEQEPAAGGKESAEASVRNLAGFRVDTHPEAKNKEARAYEYSSQVGGGNVYVLQRHWTKDLIEEHRFFPHSKYKDICDACSSAFNKLVKPRVRVGGMWSVK